jgi:hypothetical protein
METNKPDTNNNSVQPNMPSVDKKLPIQRTDEERLRENIYRSDMEKFRLFTRMLRRNAMFKRAKITHK